MLFKSVLFSALLAQLGAASILDGRAVCNDNCGRAIAGTNSRPAGIPARSSDCSAFLMAYTTVTVTPTTSYVSSIAATSCFALHSSAVPGKLTRSRTIYYGTPTYASACKGETAYASACSCLGITEIPTSTFYYTLPTPVRFLSFAYSSPFFANSSSQVTIIDCDSPTTTSTAAP